MGFVESSLCKGHIRYRVKDKQELGKVGCTGIECVLERVIRGILGNNRNISKIVIISPYEGYPLTQLIMPIACMTTYAKRGKILFISTKTSRLDEYKKFCYSRGDSIHKTLGVSRYSQRKGFDKNANLLLASEIRKIAQLIPKLNVKLLLIDHIDNNNIASYLENKDLLKKINTIHLIPSFMDKSFDDKLLEIDSLEASLIIFSHENIFNLYKYRYIPSNAINIISSSLRRMKNVANDKKIQKKIISHTSSESLDNKIFAFYEKLEETRQFLRFDMSFRKSYNKLNNNFRFISNQYLPLNDITDEELVNFGIENKFKSDKVAKETLSEWNRSTFISVNESVDSLILNDFLDAQRLLYEIRDDLKTINSKKILLKDFLDSVRDETNPPLIYIFVPYHLAVRYELCLIKFLAQNPIYAKSTILKTVTSNNFESKPPSQYLILFETPLWQDKRILESGIAETFIYLIYEFQSDEIDIDLDKVDRRRAEIVHSQTESMNEIIKGLYRNENDPLINAINEKKAESFLKRNYLTESYDISQGKATLYEKKEEIYTLEFKFEIQPIIKDYSMDDLTSLDEISREISGSNTTQTISVKFKNNLSVQFPSHIRVAKRGKSGQYNLVEISKVLRGSDIAYVNPDFKHNLFLKFVKENSEVYDSLAGFKAWKEFLRLIPQDIDYYLTLKRMKKVSEKQPTILTHYPIRNWVEQKSLGPRKVIDLDLFIKAIDDKYGIKIPVDIGLNKIWFSLKAIRVLNQSTGRQINRYLDRILINCINGIPIDKIKNNLGFSNEEVVKNINTGTIELVI